VLHVLTFFFARRVKAIDPNSLARPEDLYGRPPGAESPNGSTSGSSATFAWPQGAVPTLEVDATTGRAAVRLRPAPP
jgi:hypothetical protein